VQLRTPIAIMKSILTGRDALKTVVDNIAEVAGYLWQNGWAERNGGNITVNITELIDEEIRHLPAIAARKPIGVTLAALRGGYFFCKTLCCHFNPSSNYY